MNEVDMPDLADHERAFRTKDGITVVVGVTKRQLGEGPADEGKTDLFLQARSRVVDEDGETLSQPTPTGRTLDGDGMAEGRISIPDQIGQLTMDAVRRARDHHRAVQAWEALPVPEEERA